MADVTLQLGLLIEHLPEGLCAAEALFVPEISSVASTGETAIGALRELLPGMLAAGPASGISQRQAAGELIVESITLSIDPPREGAYWKQPIPLVFHGVRWTRPDGLHLAYVPALEVAAISDESGGLLPRLEKEIRFALQRRRASASLARLVELQRAERLEVRRGELIVSMKSAKQRAQEAAQNDAPEKSVLQEVATDLTKLPLPQAVAIDDVVQRVAEALVGRAARSVLLVGPSGVGKTAAVYELVRQREALGITERTFWATSGSRLIAGALGFGMWQERCHKLCREAAGKRAVLYLGNLVELLEVGKSNSSSMSIASFLRGYMARGDLLAIAECTPEQVAVLEREDPHFLATFRQVTIAEPAREAGRRILRHVADERLTEHAPRISESGLDVLERLHRRYATYSGFPGRPIRFVRNLLRDAGEAAVGGREITAAFARETGLPLFMLDDEVPLDVADARAWFASRVMAQDAASDLVADLLATLKAGLNRPRRPIASLLFIGPTGVGKTEMAKAMTEYFFSDRARLTRFDMSEYNTPEAVERLVGGFGRLEGLLTGRIRQQPFSVVLFDEVEKAHSAFFDLMLQVLGEARLTDASGRLADFSNSIIVMTSNLGAASFGRPGFGLRLDAGSDAAGHFTEEVRAFLRPELFNRIDRIVPFVPLDAKAIGRIARRELDLVRVRDGLRLRDVAFDLDEASAQYLAQKGFDATYGARPLKRTIERELLVPLSEALNTYSDALPLTAAVRVETGRLAVRVRATGEGPKAHGPGPMLVHRAAILRRELQRLEKSAALLDVQNEVFRLQRLIGREQVKRPNHPLLPGWYQRVKRLRGPLDAASDISREAIALEEAMLLAFYERQADDGRGWARELGGSERRLSAMLLELYALRFENPDLATVGLFGEVAADVFRLAQAYHHTAAEHRAKVTAGWYGHDARGLLLHRVEDADEYFSAGKGKPVGVAMELAGACILPLFEGESGSHAFIKGKREQPCLVVVRPGPLSGFKPPPEVHRLGSLEHTTWRRRIEIEEKTINDLVLEREMRWTRLDRSLCELMEAYLDKAIREPIA